MKCRLAEPPEGVAWNRNCYPSNCGQGGWVARTQEAPDPKYAGWDEYVTIPLVFEAGNDDCRKQVVRAAVQEYSARTCIRFIEHDHAPEPSASQPHVLIRAWHDADPGCSAKGKIVQKCTKPSSFIHEFGHILGMQHTRNRPDIHSPRKWDPEYTPYVGSKNDGPKDPFSGYAPVDTKSIMNNHGHHLSEGDVLQLLDMYQCYTENAGAYDPPNVCTCSNGYPSQNEDCIADGMESCCSCIPGTHLVSNQCEENICTCEHGTPHPGGKASFCLAHGAATCKACELGYHLNGIVCEVNKCECPEGIAAEGRACAIHGSVTCATCQTGYHLCPSEPVPIWLASDINPSRGQIIPAPRQFVIRDDGSAELPEEPGCDLLTCPLAELVFKMTCSGKKSILVTFAAQVIAPNPGADSVFIGVDSSFKEWATGVSKAWTWKNSMSFVILNPGDNKVTIRGREDGIRIKALRIKAGRNKCSFAIDIPGYSLTNKNSAPGAQIVMKRTKGASPVDCANRCDGINKCVGFVFDEEDRKKGCQLMSSLGSQNDNNKDTYVKHCHAHRCVADA